MFFQLLVLNLNYLHLSILLSKRIDVFSLYRVGCVITIMIVAMVQMKERTATRNTKPAHLKNFHVRISSVFATATDVMAKMTAEIIPTNLIAVSPFINKTYPSLVPVYFQKTPSLQHFRIATWEYLLVFRHINLSPTETPKPNAWPANPTYTLKVSWSMCLQDW